MATAGSRDAQSANGIAESSSSSLLLEKCYVLSFENRIAWPLSRTRALFLLAIKGPYNTVKSHDDSCWMAVHREKFLAVQDYLSERDKFGSFLPFQSSTVAPSLITFSLLSLSHRSPECPTLDWRRARLAREARRRPRAPRVRLQRRQPRPDDRVEEERKAAARRSVRKEEIGVLQCKFRPNELICSLKINTISAKDLISAFKSFPVLV